MSEFIVSGPFIVPVYNGKKGRILRSEEGDAFFERHAAMAEKRGCYVFAMRSGGGLTPVYVGKATKSFEQECFTAHKIGKCNEALVDYERGTLVALFLESAGGGRPNNKHVADLEEFLIQAAVSVNPELLNVKGTKQADWSIRGIIRSAAGKRSAAATALKTALAL